MGTQEQSGAPNPERPRSCRSAADPPDARSGTSSAPIHLSSIELALIAQFNLEMAESYDEVADDPELSVETRQRARESASWRRGRARLFHSEARRLGANPTSVTGQSTEDQPPPYAGPERRKRERRIRERRSSPQLKTAGLGHPDRRTDRDRREQDRRSQTQHAR
jgi:hypothetical protein